MSKLNVNIGEDFPLDGDVAAREHRCGHHSEQSREAWREWKREQHEMRERWRREWHERFHAFRDRMKHRKEQDHA